MQTNQSSKPKRGKAKAAARAKAKRVSRLILPTPQSAWTTILGWRALTGMSESTTYNWISRRILETRKDGTRVYINVQKGLAAINDLPPANVRLKRAPPREPAAQTAQIPATT